MTAGETFTMRFSKQPTLSVGKQFDSPISDDHQEYIFPGLIAVVERVTHEQGSGYLVHCKLHDFT